MMAAARLWRVTAGAAILLLLAAFGVLLIPHYLRNMEFQRSLEAMAQDAENRNTPDEVVEVRVVDRAARLGLAIRPEQVRLHRSGERLRIEVRYAVPIDLPFYTVDLHFRASAGR
jgi:hypothetical protein